jgi:hypothetical protein
VSVSSNEGGSAVMKVNASQSMILLGLGAWVFFVTLEGASSPFFEVGSLLRIRRASFETAVDIGQTVLECSHLKSLSWFVGDAEALLYGSTDRFATLVPLPPGEEANVVLYIPPTSLLLAKPSGYSRFERVVLDASDDRNVWLRIQRPSLFGCDDDGLLFGDSSCRR